MFVICGICVWVWVFLGEICIFYLCMVKDAGIYVQVALCFGELEYDELELFFDLLLFLVLL